jgi:hypothetical protein
MRSACNHSTEYPAKVENTSCSTTHLKPEFNAHHTNQLIFFPMEHNADDSIDICMKIRNSNTQVQTEAQDAIFWLDNCTKSIPSFSSV